MLKTGSKLFNLLLSAAVVVVTGFMVATQKDILALNLIYFALFPAVLFGGGALFMVVAASIFIGIVIAGMSIAQVIVFIFPLAFTGGMLMIFKAKIDQFNRAFENISLIDPATGLYNYFYFQSRLKEEKERSDRFGSKLSLIMIDIDGFIEDQEMGGLFRQIADIIIEQVRAVDIVSRYNQSKFAIIMPNTSGEAAEIAERIRAFVEKADFDGGKATVSAGLATYPTNADDENILIERADTSLNLAAEAGGNRVFVYGG